jgi:hypothetical protein
MTFWRLLHVPINVYVIEEVLTSVQVDVFIIYTNDYVVTFLSFRLSDEVGLMLTFILALLVKVNEVFGGAASAGPVSLCSASIAFALLFPAMVTSFLLGSDFTLGLPFSLALEKGTSFPLPLPLPTAPFPVARTLGNVSMCFRHRHSYGNSGSGRVITHEHLILLFSNR